MMSVAIRHKNDVRLCAWGATAFYFFYRFMIEKEEFPDFTSNKDWYGIRVLKSCKEIEPHRSPTMLRISLFVALSTLLVLRVATPLTLVVDLGQELLNFTVPPRMTSREWGVGMPVVWKTATSPICLAMLFVCAMAFLVVWETFGFLVLALSQGMNCKQ